MIKNYTRGEKIIIKFCKDNGIYNMFSRCVKHEDLSFELKQDYIFRTSNIMLDIITKLFVKNKYSKNRHKYVRLFEHFNSIAISDEFRRMFINEFKNDIIQFIIENNLANQLDANIKKNTLFSSLISFLDYFFNHPKTISLFNESFRWNKSYEGYTYWDSINKKYINFILNKINEINIDK